MLAKLCITCNLFGCNTVTSQTTTLNLANCICLQKFVDPKTEKSLPDSLSLGVYIYSVVVKLKLITRSCFLWQSKCLSKFAPKISARLITLQPPLPRTTCNFCLIRHWLSKLQKHVIIWLVLKVPYFTLQKEIILQLSRLITLRKAKILAGKR